WLEKIRRSGIRIDRDGRFVHDGAEVLHEGLKRALFRWLDRLPEPDGRYVLRLDAERFAYVDVDDTPLVATSLRWAGDDALLGLTDGSEEALDPTTVTASRACGCAADAWRPASAPPPPARWPNASTAPATRCRCARAAGRCPSR